MKKCKKCETEFEERFKFCPECGEKYVETMEDWKSKIEAQLAEVRAMIETLLSKPEKVVVTEKKQHKKYPKRGRSVDWDKRWKEFCKYVRDHPDRAFPISVLFEEVIGSSASGDAYRNVERMMEEKKHYGIKIKKKGKRTLIMSNKYGKGKVDSSSNEKSRIRAKYIATRANELVKIGKTKKDAWTIASAEFKEEQEKGKYMLRDKPLVPKTTDEQRIAMATEPLKKKFPKIEGLQKKYVQVLVDMLRNAMKEGNELGLIDAGALEVEKGTDFASFMMSLSWHANEIAEFFGIPNKFCFRNGGDERKLFYKKRVDFDRS